MTNTTTESVADIIASEWEMQHGVPPNRSPRKYRAFCHRMNLIAQRVREGQNENDTVQLTGCSWRVYRRVAAAVAAEPDVYVHSDPLR